MTHNEIMDDRKLIMCKRIRPWMRQHNKFKEITNLPEGFIEREGFKWFVKRLIGVTCILQNGEIIFKVVDNTHTTSFHQIEKAALFMGYNEPIPELEGQ